MRTTGWRSRPAAKRVWPSGMLRLVLQEGALSFGGRCVLSAFGLHARGRGEKTGRKAGPAPHDGRTVLEGHATPRPRGRHGIPGPQCPGDRGRRKPSVHAFPGRRPAIDFSNPSSLGQTAPATHIKALADRMARGQVSALIVYRANPVYALPATPGHSNRPSKVTTLISLSSFPDETTRLRDPPHAFPHLPRIMGGYRPQRNVPACSSRPWATLFDTRHLGDILLSLGKGLGGQAKFPEKGFYDCSSADGSKARGRHGPLPQSLLATGPPAGRRVAQGRQATRRARRPERFALSPLRVSPPRKTTTFDFFIYPTIQFFDGSLANRPFLQEMPDPVTMVTWDGWVEINPDAAKRLDIEKGRRPRHTRRQKDGAGACLSLSRHPGRLARHACRPGPRASVGRYVTGKAGNPNETLRTARSPQAASSGRSPGSSSEDRTLHRHRQRRRQRLSAWAQACQSHRRSANTEHQGARAPDHHAPAFGMETRSETFTRATSTWTTDGAW